MIEKVINQMKHEMCIAIQTFLDSSLLEWRKCIELKTALTAPPASVTHAANKRLPTVKM